MTIQEVKDLLRIKNDADDAYLSAIIPLVEEFVADYCNNTFLNDLGEVDYPGGVQIAIAKLCQYHMRESGIQSESLSSHRITYAEGLRFPSDLTKLLNTYRRPLFK